MKTSPSVSTPPTSSAPTINSAPSRRSGRVPKPTPNPEELLTSPSAVKSSLPKPMEPTSTPTATAKPRLKGYDPDYKEKDKGKTRATSDNPTPWRHPDEFPFVSRAEWSQDLMMEYMRYHSFSVPPPETNSKIQLVPILLWGSLPPTDDPVGSDSSLVVWLPRGYRVPLMFIAKFQWDSLRIVLNAADPKADWDAFKFNILHLSRLCQHLFQQAREARRKAIAALESSPDQAVMKARMKGEKDKAVVRGFDKSWRCPAFDRLLTRFYNKWFLSTDEWLENFFNEFDEEEYHERDIVKLDWIRWALKGHKGFVLTKDEIQNGITSEQYMWGLEKVPDGSDSKFKWLWESKGEPPQNTVSGWSIPRSSSDPDSVEVKREIVDYVMANMANGVSVKSKISIDRRFFPLFDGITNAPKALTTPPSRPSKLKAVNPTPTQNPTKTTATAASAASTATKASASVSKSSSTATQPQTSTTQKSSKPPAARQTARIRTENPPRIPLRTFLNKNKKAEGSQADKSNQAGKGMDNNNKGKPAEGSVGKKRKRAEVEGEAGGISDVGRNKRKKAQDGASISRVSSRSDRPTEESEEDSDESSEDDSEEDDVRKDKSYRAQTNLKKKMDAGASLNPSVTRKLHEGSGTSRGTSSSTPSLSHTPKPAAAQAPQNGAKQSEGEKVATKKRTPDTSTAASSSLRRTASQDVGKVKELPSGKPPFVLRSFSSKISRPESTAQPAVHADGSTVSVPTKVTNSANNNNIAPLKPIQDSSQPTTPTVSAPTQSPDITKMREYVKLPSRLFFPKVSTAAAANPPSVLSKVLVADIPKAATPDLNGKHLTDTAALSASGGPDPNRVSSSGNTPVPASATSRGTSSGVSQPPRPADDHSQRHTPTPTQGHNSDTEMIEIEANMNQVDCGDSSSLSSFDIASSAQSDDNEPPPPTKKTAVVNKTTPESKDKPTTDQKDKPTTVEKHDPITTDEKMDVDEVESQPVRQSPPAAAPPPPAQPPSGDQAQPESVGLLMSQGNRAKSLHTILLLRDLLQFLRVPGWGNLREVFERRGRGLSMIDAGTHKQVNGQTQTQTQTQTQAQTQTQTQTTQHGLLDDEEVMTVDQRLDILAHASVAMAQVLFPFRGEELSSKIDSLDNRLQQQFDMLWKPEDRPPLRSTESLAKAFEDKEAQTILLEALSKETQTLEEEEPPKPEPEPPRSFDSQEIQTSNSVDYSDATVQTDVDVDKQEASASRVRSQSNSGDAVMVDGTSPLPVAGPSTAELPKPPNTTAEPATPTAKAMMSIMKNIADLLELEEGGTATKSAKGKERETSVADVGEMSSDRGNSSLVVDAIVNEFKAMKEELREIQQKSHKEFESLTTMHRSEVESLKNELRSRDDRGKDELELIQQRHKEELERLRESIRTMDKEKEKKTEVEDETRIPPWEFLEIRRRVALLESQNRHDLAESMANSPAASPSVSQFSEHRHATTFHPLGHLLAQDFEDAPTPSLAASPSSRYFVRENSTPNPGTPVSTGNALSSSSRPEGADLDENSGNPLPIKSQRKMHMMMFPRSSVG